MSQSFNFVAMELNFKTFGTGPALVILHGLFGSLDNWVTLGRRYSEHFSVYLLDARNHGKSSHTDEFNYPAMANDVLAFLEKQRIQSAHIIGHSMGGKTAMRFCLDHSQKINKMIVADMPPIANPRGHDEIFEAIFSLPVSSLSSRNEAEDILAPKIPDISTRLFILKNLDRRREGGFEWKFNLPAIYKEYHNILEAIESPSPAQNPVLFLKGSKSRYVNEGSYPFIFKLFPNAKIETIENAGHWLHAEQPDSFYEVSMKFFNPLVSAL